MLAPKACVRTTRLCSCPCNQAFSCSLRALVLALELLRDIHCSVCAAAFRVRSVGLRARQATRQYDDDPYTARQCERRLVRTHVESGVHATTRTPVGRRLSSPSASDNPDRFRRAVRCQSLVPQVRRSFRCPSLYRAPARPFNESPSSPPPFPSLKRRCEIRKSGCEECAN